MRAEPRAMHLILISLPCAPPSWERWERLSGKIHGSAAVVLAFGLDQRTMQVEQVVADLLQGIHSTLDGVHSAAAQEPEKLQIPRCGANATTGTIAQQRRPVLARVACQL